MLRVAPVPKQTTFRLVCSAFSVGTRSLSTNSSQSVVVWSSTARLGLMLERIRRRTLLFLLLPTACLQSSNVIKMTLILIAVRIDVV